MKLLPISMLLILMSHAFSAHAACTTATQVQGAATLRAVLQGKTVCAARGGDRWQEFHRSDGALIDYKKGPSDPVDPTKQVGSWAVTGNGAGTQLRYDYGRGGNYTYKVHTITEGSTYSLCSGTEDLVVTLRTGQGPC